MSEGTFTYQTRIQLEEEPSAILDEYADLFGHIQRSLFAEIAKGADPSSLKALYLKRFAITARQFNAIRVDTVGKIDSCKKLLSLQMNNLQDRIDSLKKKIEKLGKKKTNRSLIHQKKRRLQNLQYRALKLKSDQEMGKVRLCFGSKKLFRAQFALEKNHYRSREEWKRDWDNSRNSHFFLLGSKDENAGNQSCVATIQENGSFSLRLRLPNVLAKSHGKFLTISNVNFQYGQDKIMASLQSCLERKLNSESPKNHGQAICYRFKKDKKGWTVFATTEIKKPKIITRNDFGAIGVDINADHLALVEVDRFGNPIQKRTIPLNTHGKRTNQSFAMIGNACKEIIDWAEQTKKPIIHERLDFQKKKAFLKEDGIKKHSRMLSSLAYNRIITQLKAKAFRHGVATFSVNPAHTSTIGNIKFSNRYGLSKHHAAALCIARRYFGFSEQPPKSSVKISDGRECQLTLSLPVRNRGKHVWVFWGLVRRKMRTALAAHFRAMRNRSTDPPLAGRFV